MSIFYMTVKTYILFGIPRPKMSKIIIIIIIIIIIFLEMCACLSVVVFCCFYGFLGVVLLLFLGFFWFCGIFTVSSLFQKISA